MSVSLRPYGLYPQVPLCMGFSRQEYGSGLPCPAPGDLPNPGIELASLMSPALAGGFCITSTLRKHNCLIKLTCPDCKYLSIIYIFPSVTLEKEMATHSSILARRIPWTEEPGGLQSTGSQRVGHDWSDLACTHCHLSSSLYHVLTWVTVSASHQCSLTQFLSSSNRFYASKSDLSERRFCLIVSLTAKIHHWLSMALSPNSFAWFKKSSIIWPFHMCIAPSSITILPSITLSLTFSSMYTWWHSCFCNSLPLLHLLPSVYPALTWWYSLQWNF